MSEIVTTITGAFSAFVTGIGGSIVSAFNSIMFEGTGDTRRLSALATWSLVFLGVSLALGLVRKFTAKA